MGLEMVLEEMMSIEMCDPGQIGCIIETETPIIFITVLVKGKQKILFALWR